jgi:hypothetical protein
MSRKSRLVVILLVVLAGTVASAITQQVTAQMPEAPTWSTSSGLANETLLPAVMPRLDCNGDVIGTATTFFAANSPAVSPCAADAANTQSGSVAIDGAP